MYFKKCRHLKFFIQPCMFHLCAQFLILKYLASLNQIWY